MSRPLGGEMLGKGKGIEMTDLENLLEKSSEGHIHLCPRQVLGVRMGLYAGELLGLELPQEDKRLMVIVETDGCMLDGVGTATGCSSGKRTMRVEDYGKVAATFIDTHTGRAIRIVPATGCRMGALEYAPGAKGKWQGQLLGYQRMPAQELFSSAEVELTVPIDTILGKPKMKATCSLCGEEIINGREVYAGEDAFCRSCAGETYYLQPGLSEQGAFSKVTLSQTSHYQRT
jgi:formylmethanofuran dehydrogenase subunit E